MDSWSWNGRTLLGAAAHAIAGLRVFCTLGNDSKVISDVILSKETRIKIMEEDIVNSPMSVADTARIFTDDRAENADLDESIYEV